jgi:hypothetical protein
MASKREDVYKHFKFTPRAAIISIVGLFVFPASIYWVAASTDVRFAKTTYTQFLLTQNNIAAVEVGRDKERATLCRQSLGTYA